MEKSQKYVASDLQVLEMVSFTDGKLSTQNIQDSMFRVYNYGVVYHMCKLMPWFILK